MRSFWVSQNALVLNAGLFLFHLRDDEVMSITCNERRIQGFMLDFIHSCQSLKHPKHRRECKFDLFLIYKKKK